MFAVLSSLFPKSKGFRTKHVDWSNYTSEMGKGLDLRVFQRSRQIIGMEVKDFREYDRPYGTDFVRKHVLERFKNFAGGVKILIISFLCLLTRKGLELIESHGIHIVEVGKVFSIRKDVKTPLFWKIRSKVEQLWLDYKHEQELRRRPDFGCVSLDRFVKCIGPSVDMIHNKDNPLLRQLTKTHDSDSKKQLVETHQNSLVERILSPRKQARNKENQYEAHGFWLIPIKEE